MSDREEYFRKAESWATDTRAREARSNRLAYIVASIACAAALFEAVAIALMLPLKTVQPVTLLVDRQTGYVQALDPTSPRRVAADEALTQSFLAQYVTAREGFDRATVASDYKRVALWSTGPARASYLSLMPATNPNSPFQQYRSGTFVQTRVKSVSRLSQGVALVRFDTQLQDRTGRAAPAQPWVAVVRYRYIDAAMRLEDRFVNPLGFQVLSYRRDAEVPTDAVRPSALPLDTPAQPGPAYGAASTPAIRRMSAPAAASGLPAVAEGGPLIEAPRQSVPASAARATTRREVPINALPLGSPLTPPTAASAAGEQRR